eukprot:g13267.t1
MPYQKLTSHRAAVCLPYDTTIFLFNELYGANMPIFELSPFFASIHQPLGVEQALEWSSYSDWALLPHVFYFQGIPELFKQLMDMEALLTASAAMKAFNDEELIFAVEHWRKVAQRLLAAVAPWKGTCRELKPSAEEVVEVAISDESRRNESLRAGGWVCWMGDGRTGKG